MSAENLHIIERPGLRAVAQRKDRHWGHAVDVELYRSGQLLGRASFCCHPEFAEFDHYQKMNTEQLISVVEERLESVISNHEGAWRIGALLLLRFNSPNADRPNLA